MSLDQKQIQKVAKLAKIKIAENEMEIMSSEIAKIMEIMQILSEIDDSGEIQNSKMQTHMRKDKVTDGNLTEDILKNAPETAFGCFYKVPKVII